MNIYFSNDEAVTLKIEIKATYCINGDIDFRLLQFVKYVFILQVSKNRSSLSFFFKIKYTWYIMLYHITHKYTSY